MTPEETVAQTQPPEAPRINYLNNGSTLRSWLLTKDPKQKMLSARRRGQL